ncbi:MAG: sigma-54 dependent transcriptional regulator, partial [Acidobacteria bacterium]|nr:sigma-54 dependent transcriptional regulator [Acidobacteriota bacterium]
MEKARILVVEDDVHMMSFLVSALERNGFVSLPASDCERALRIQARSAPDLAILDYKLARDGSGLELARLMRRQDSNFPVILITAFGTEDLAIEALREGIDEYLRKPFLLDDLLGSIQRLLPPQAVGPGQTPVRPPEDAPNLVDGERLVGDSAGLCDIKRSIKKLGRGDSSVLILGETGTGKELVAELIHKNSQRAARAFVCLNCAAIPDTLVESELFGHERGAFTGAYAGQIGRLMLAEGGTLLLDEVGDMSLPAQAKVLRVLDGKPIQRVGGRRDTPLDVRVIAATNQNLEESMASGKFRRDLYFRLNVSQIVLPPLRERKEDIPLLVRHFLSDVNQRLARHVEGASKELLDKLLRFDWPGNVRELKNVIEACALNRDAGLIGVADTPEHYRSKLATGVIGEKEMLLSALCSTRWNKSKAAQHLHWSRMTLYRKLAKYQIGRKSDP